MSLFEENRWLQRFQNYQRALTHLDQAIKITEDKTIEEFSDLEIQGTINALKWCLIYPGKYYRIISKNKDTR